MNNISNASDYLTQKNKFFDKQVEHYFNNLYIYISIFTIGFYILLIFLGFMTRSIMNDRTKNQTD